MMAEMQTIAVLTTGLDFPPSRPVDIFQRQMEWNRSAGCTKAVNGQLLYDSSPFLNNSRGGS